MPGLRIIVSRVFLLLLGNTYIGHLFYISSPTSLTASQVALLVKNLPANAGDMRDKGSIPGGEDLPEEGMATHSSVLAWRISWTQEPGRLWSIVTQRTGHD